MIGPTLWYVPPFSKGGTGGFWSNPLNIPLNPPLEKGDFEVGACEVRPS